MTELFRCPLCGGTEAMPDMTLRDRVAGTTAETSTLVRCAACDLLRLRSLPNAARFACAYGPGYVPHQRPDFSGRAKGWLERRSVRR